MAVRYLSGTNQHSYYQGLPGPTMVGWPACLVRVARPSPGTVPWWGVNMARLCFSEQTRSVSVEKPATEKHIWMFICIEVNTQEVSEQHLAPSWAVFLWPQGAGHWGSVSQWALGGLAVGSSGVKIAVQSSSWLSKQHPPDGHPAQGWL